MITQVRSSVQYKQIVPYQCHFWQVALAYAFWLSRQTGKRYRVFKIGICWRVEETDRLQPQMSLGEQWIHRQYFPRCSRSDRHDLYGPHMN